MNQEKLVNVTMRGAQCASLKQRIVRQTLFPTNYIYLDRFLFLALKRKKEKKKWRDNTKIIAGGSVRIRFRFHRGTRGGRLQLSTQGKNFILFLFVPLSRNEDTAGYLARGARESKTGDNAGLFLEAWIHIRARKQRSPRPTRIEKSHLCGLWIGNR